MRVDIYAPSFTQADAVACTSADAATINNYLHYGHVASDVVDGRRRFSVQQLVKIELILRLADLFKIPPRVGGQLAEQLIDQVEGLLALDAANVGDDQWTRAAGARAQITIRRDGGEVRVSGAGEGGEDCVDLIVPVQLFARGVLRKAALIAAERGVA